MPKPIVPLDVARVRSALAGTRFADVRYRTQTGSTNADAQPLLGDAGARGTTLVAEHQDAGKGRKGRRWIAPPGSALLFTTLLPVAVASRALWAVPFWTALAVAAAVQRSTAITLDLVWPNDLHAAGRKTGGILSVARVVADEAWVGCGVGLNVLHPGPDTDLDALVPPPLFLDELVATASREAILIAVLRVFDETLAGLHDPSAVAAAWERRAGLASTTYRFTRDADGVEREGVALRLGPDGTLIVRDRSGADVTLDLADVRITRSGRP